MLIAAVISLPVGIADARPAFTDVTLLGAAIGVGISSSVIPYICDQLAMARLPRATFALMLSLLPATASLIGLVVLRQVRPRSKPRHRAGHRRRRAAPRAQGAELG